MFNATHILNLSVLFLLVSCAAVEKKRPASGQITPDTATIVDRFENKLAEKLLHLALNDIQASSKDERFQLVDAHRRKLNQSLDVSRLSTSNQRQLRLFEYLWHSERSKSDMAKTGLSYMEKLKLETSLSSDAADFSAQAQEKLSTLHAKIRLLTETPEQTSLKPLFEATRNNPENYLPNTHAGRQKYLDLIIDSLTRIERLIPPLYVVRHSEFTLKGVEDREDKLLFVYDTSTKTLNIDLGDMNQLPLYEVDSVASYYGVPGMHTISSIRPLEIQSIISIPGYAGGWAAYVTSNLNRMPPFQHPGSELAGAYFEAMVISLAIADIGLHTENWSVDQAITFAMDSSPYPFTRLKNSIHVASQVPGTFSAPLLARLQFEKLQEQSNQVLKQDFILSEFHHTVLNPGVLPFPELQKVVTDWTKQKMPVN